LFAAAFALSLQRAADELIFQKLSTLVTEATVSVSRGSLGTLAA
jgi:hypothetical protein